jgi:hypothetical protein
VRLHAHEQRRDGRLGGRLRHRGDRARVAKEASLRSTSRDDLADVGQLANENAPMSYEPADTAGAEAASKDARQD